MQWDDRERYGATTEVPLQESRSVDVRWDTRSEAPLQKGRSSGLRRGVQSGASLRKGSTIDVRRGEVQPEAPLEEGRRWGARRSMQRCPEGEVAGRSPSSGAPNGNNVKPPVNDVDSWIDQLDPTETSNSFSMLSGITASVLMASLAQQHLPKVEIPVFDGSPLKWVEFVVKFRDVVHNQPYLNDKQRNQQLIQHLTGEAKRAVKEYINDPRGYPLSLQKLKYLFGQRSTVARAVLAKVTKGASVAAKDFDGLSELYYSICDCLITLKQLNHDSDLSSSDTLHQAVQRLPPDLIMKWSEASLVIRRRHEEPTLRHLEAWLKDRVLARREAGALAT